MSDWLSTVLDEGYDEEHSLEVETVGCEIRVTGFIRTHRGRCCAECDCGERTVTLYACGICGARCRGDLAIDAIAICDECDRAADAASEAA